MANGTPLTKNEALDAAEAQLKKVTNSVGAEQAKAYAAAGAAWVEYAKVVDA